MWPNSSILLSHVSHRRFWHNARVLAKLYQYVDWPPSQTRFHNASKSVFLVGGFSASEYLFSGLKESLKAEKLDICRPDSHVYVLSYILLNLLIPYHFSIETKLSLTGRSLSTWITLLKHAYQSSHMAPTALLPTAKMTLSIGPDRIVPL